MHGTRIPAGLLKALAACEKYIDLHGEKYQEVQDRVKRLRAMIAAPAK